MNRLDFNSNFSTTKSLFKFCSSEINNNFKVRVEDNHYSFFLLPKTSYRFGEGGLRKKGFIKKNNSQYPLISIITVVYNGEVFLEDTIKSVINQNYPNIEYIIIDGGSKDRTIDVILKYENLIDYWISEQDLGIYDAMNKGLSLAVGKGLNFLNAGDYFQGDVFSINQKIPFYVKTLVKGNYEKSRFLDLKKTKKLGMPVCHQAVIFDNTNLLYNTNYKLSADYDYFLRSGAFERLIPGNLNSVLIYDNGGVSARNHYLRDLESLKIIYNNFGFFFALTFLCKRVFINFIKFFVKW